MVFQRGDLRALVTPLVTEFCRDNQPIKPLGHDTHQARDLRRISWLSRHHSHAGFFVMTTAVAASAGDARQAAQK